MHAPAGPRMRGPGPRRMRRGLPERKPPAFSAGGFRSRFGPIGTGRGTCQKGPIRLARTAGGADVCGFARAYVESEANLAPTRMMITKHAVRNRTFVHGWPASHFPCYRATFRSDGI